MPLAETELAGAPAVRSLDGGPSLSIVVPVFNEAATIDELYRRTVAAVEPTAARSS